MKAPKLRTKDLVAFGVIAAIAAFFYHQRQLHLNAFEDGFDCALRGIDYMYPNDNHEDCERQYEKELEVINRKMEEAPQYMSLWIDKRNRLIELRENGVRCLND